MGANKGALDQGIHVQENDDVEATEMDDVDAMEAFNDMDVDAMELDDYNDAVEAMELQQLLMAQY